MKRTSCVPGIRHKIAVFVIIFVSLARIIYNFTYLKDGFHSDEVWSFGLANSYFEPFIYQTADHSDKSNFEQWISGDVMKSYMTVDENHRFAYDSVWFNQKYENHPPLFYSVLHTVCSFFPGKINLWYGFVVNIAAFIITMIFLYLLAADITESYSAALICCIFYGFSAGTLDTFVYVRMYAMLTAVSVISLYFHSRLYRTGNIKRYCIILIPVTVAGALTHHYYVPFSLIISFCFCLYYLIKKNYKIMLAYGLSILGALGLSLVFFPAAISHLFSEKLDEPKFTMSWQIVLTFNCILRELFGVELPVVPPVSPMVVIIVTVCVLIIVSPLLYLFRASRFIIMLPELIIRFISEVKGINLMIWAMIMASLGICFLTSLTVSLFLMGDTADRYLFLIYPSVCITGVSFLKYIFIKIVKHKNTSNLLTAVLCVVLCVTSNFKYGCIYLFSKPDDVVSIKDIITDENCVYITNTNWFLTCFAWVSTDASLIYAMNCYDLEPKLRSIPDVPTSDNVIYYIVDTKSFKTELSEEEVFNGEMPVRGISSTNNYKITEEQFMLVLNSMYSDIEYVGHDFLFDREHLIYKICNQ